MPDRQGNPFPVAGWKAGDWLLRLGVPGYIASGAIAKLITGRPLELPLISLVREPSAELERLAAVALPLLAAVELAVAWAILFGGRWSRWLGLAVLTAFAAVLIPHVSAGAESCGCFGAAAANPSLMLTTAISGAALLLLLPAAGTPLVTRPWLWTAGGALAAAVLVTSVTLGQLPERLGWRVPMVRLRPDAWVGLRIEQTPFYPLLEAEDGGATSFSEPEQTWVLWLRTCPHCHEYFHERWSSPTPRRIVAVEIPLSPRGISPEQHSIECPSCVRLHLRAGTFYAPAPTPIVVTVVNGRVTSAQSNPASPTGGVQETP